MNPFTMTAVSKNTLKKRRHRANIRKDAKRHEEAKAKDRARKKRARAERACMLKRNKMMAMQERKKATEAKRKYRAKKKAEKSRTDIPDDGKRGTARRDFLSRQMKVIKRKRNAQKKLEKLEKRNDVMRCWRLRVKLTGELDTDTPSAPNFSSPSQKCTALKRARLSLPKTPEKRAEIIERLSQSPRCSMLLKQKQLIHARRNEQYATSVITSLSKIYDAVKPRGGMTAPHKQAYTALQQAVLSIKSKYGYRRNVHDKLNASWKARKSEDNWWQKIPKRKARSDRTSQQTLDEIKDFYTDGLISKTDPSKKCVKKTPNGEFLPRYVMTCTLQEAYKVYKARYPGRKVGFTTFKKAKPSNVRKVSETSKRSCLCQICCNAALKAEGLRNFVSQTEQLKPHLKMVKMSKTDVTNITVCEYDGKYPKSACLMRSCKECGPVKLSQYYKPIIEHHEDDFMTWYKWQPMNLATGDKVKRITSCVKQETTVKEFITQYEKDMDTLPSHLFRASWQQEQRNQCIETLTETEAALVMDYAQNYACSFKDESQNAFFDKNQVTVHPMMLYYNVEEDNQNILVKHAVIGITDDDVKDAAGVRHWCTTRGSIKIAKQNIDVQNLHEWTDGCACQYKGKNSFYDMSAWKQNVTRNYFETSHGKSVCDGLGATVKTCASRAEYSGQIVIATASDLYNFCKATLEHPRKLIKSEGVSYISKREFVFINQQDVDHTPRNVKTLPGTRKIHSVKNALQEPGQLEIRSLSCYCRNCELGTSPCINGEYIPPWEPATVKTSLVTTEPAKGDKISPQTVSTVEDIHIANQRNNPTDVSSEHKKPRCKQTHQLQEGEFVAVILSDKKKATGYLYMAEVVSLEGNSDVILHYMHNDNGVYRWADDRDISVEPVSAVVCQMTTPTVVNSRGQFKFEQQDVARAKEMALMKPFIRTVFFK